MINYYQGARTNTKVFKQLGCTREDRWSKFNYILYIITGKKILYTNSRSWLLTKGTAVFVKKGACIIEEVNGEVLCLMAFFIPDSYLRSFLSENIALLAKEKNNTHENELVLSLEVNKMMLAYYESVIPYFFSPVKPPEYLL